MNKTKETILEKCLGIFVVITMICLTIVINVEVIARYIFGSSLTWSLEISRILFLWVVFIGAALGLYYGDYTAIDFISKRFGPVVNKLIPVILGFFFIMLFVLGIQYFQKSHITKYVISGIPYSVVYIFPPITALLLFIFAIKILLKKDN